MLTAAPALIALAGLAACDRQKASTPAGPSMQVETQAPADDPPMPSAVADEPPMPSAVAPAGSADGPPAVASGEPPSGGADLAAEAAKHIVRGDCSLKIDGKTYIDVRRTCPIYLYPGQGGALMINSEGVPPITGYFAQLEPAGDGTAAAYWNEEPGATHAQARIADDLRRTGGCWSNARVELCAVKR